MKQRHQQPQNMPKPKMLANVIVCGKELLDGRDGREQNIINH